MARIRRLRRHASTAALVVAVVAWALLLRPQILGGPAAYVMVSGTSMEPGLHTGDLVIARKRSSYRVGDVIAYAADVPGANGAQVIHRIIGGSAEVGFVTQGDNRQAADLWHPKPDDIAGELWLSIPKLALVLAFTRTAPGLALLAAIIAFAVVVAPDGRRKQADSAATNLPAPHADGMQVIFPSRVAAAAAPAVAGRPSLSSASPAELDALPGIGPVTAQKIVDYRTAEGGFRSVEDLEAIPGIGPARVAKLRELVLA